MADDKRFIGTAPDGALLYLTLPADERVTIDLAALANARPGYAILGQPGTGKGMVRP